MKTIWCFGDSFTAGEGCRPGEYYYGKYKKDGDKIWTDWLSEWYAVNVINRGKSGASNDMIIDSIIDDFKDIKKGDCVIIGKTLSNRFDVPYVNDNGEKILVPIYSNWLDNHPKNDDMIKSYEINQLETIINFQYYFSANPLYSERQDKRYNFLIKLLKERNVNVFFWEWYKMENDFESIYKASNSKIVDAHWSFAGNKLFAVYLITKFFNQIKGYNLSGVDFKNIKTLV